MDKPSPIKLYIHKIDVNSVEPIFLIDVEHPYFLQYFNINHGKFTR